VTNQLQHYEHTYRALAAELAQVGFISQGSIVHRYTSCANPGCRCQGDPSQRHGPYYEVCCCVALDRDASIRHIECEEFS